jgi:hypothetical protein
MTHRFGVLQIDNYRSHVLNRSPFDRGSLHLNTYYAREAVIMVRIWLTINLTLNLIVLIRLHGRNRQNQNTPEPDLYYLLIPPLTPAADLVANHATRKAATSAGRKVGVHQHTAYYTLTADIVAQLYKRLYE